MENQDFDAWLVSETPDGGFERRLTRRSVTDLPDGETLIRVHYSALNYKDGLSCIGNRGVTRSYPHTPGIDAAGVVVASADGAFAPNDPVLVTSYDLGMNTAGGFGQMIRVPSDWVVPMPATLSMKEAMIYGTAGFTAALCIDRIESAGVTPEAGDILVTGATGGVGSLAVALLAHAGYSVAAVSGKTEHYPMLEALGAKEIIGREEAVDDSGRPMLKGRWAGVVDTVGGDILASALKAIQYDGAVACCGLVASPTLNTTVFPFILRNISLMGVDSAATPMAVRRAIWDRLAGAGRPSGLENVCTEVALADLDPYIDRILGGRVAGRVVVRVSEAG